MLKLTFCLRRKAGLTLAEFQDYWFNQHAPLVARHREALHIARYVQLHSLETPANDGVASARHAPAPYDGVAQLWWNSMDDLLAGTGTPAAMEAGRVLLEDERKFIDLENSPLWFGEEKIIF